jgi:hypothetical protein
MRDTIKGIKRTYKIRYNDVRLSVEAKRWQCYEGGYFWIKIEAIKHANENIMPIMDSPAFSKIQTQIEEKVNK